MRRFYTTFEAARVLGVSLPTVVNWIKARRIKAHRTPGGHRRIAREDLAAFMVRQGIPMPTDLQDAAAVRRKALVVALPGPAREGSARQLAQAGFAVEQASIGFAAGAAAARFEPDVVVLHVAGPDGGETATALRGDRELGGTPVVAIGRPEWGDSLRDAGCDVTIAAPLGEGALVRAVDALLAERRRPGTARGEVVSPRPRLHRRRSDPSAD